MLSSGVSGYAAINTRVRAKYASLLTPQDIAAMSDAEDYPTLIDQLRHSRYSEYLAMVPEGDLTPRRAVFQIKTLMADTYVSVIQASPAHTRDLLDRFYRRFEVDNLKAVLRGILSKAPWSQVHYVLFPFGDQTILPAETMLESGSVVSAIELLRDTAYYETLSHAMERYTAEQSLFPLEVALDLYYWRALWNEVGHLPNQDREQALRIIGSLLDMNNLMWAIRYRVYHHLSEEELINYTLPFGYRVRDDDVCNLAAGADIAQMLNRIYPNLHDVDTLLHEPRQGLPLLEIQLQRIVADQCRGAFSGYPFTVGIPLAFLVLNEYEIQDLTVLIEAKSSKIPSERFHPYLLNQAEPS
jgi:V/A-type H+/Na+-transporting ATPase subunit C